MGWAVSVVMIVLCLFNRKSLDVETVLIASGLFAIAGSISEVANQVAKKNIDKEEVV